MFRTTRFASRIALAMALAGGVAFASPALAQDYSKDFVAAYQPVATVVNAEGGDIASVSGQFESLVAISDSADEQFAVGNLILSAGNKAKNPAWQRRGVALQLASGKVPPESVAQYQWILGNLAFQAEDYAAARAALEAAVAAGWTQEDPTALLAETYYAQDDVAGGIAYVTGQVEQRRAAGGEVPEQWLLRGLQAAYQADLVEPSTRMALLLVQDRPSQTHWTNALQVINAIHEFDPDVRLDLLRLMRETNTLSNRAEFIRYIEAADPRIMSNEVEDVLAAAVQAGELSSGDDYYREVNSIVQTRKAADRNEADAFFTEAQTKPNTALGAGDVLYSLDDFARAERVYAIAAERGNDPQAALTRMGIAQVKQGKYAEAIETFGRVTGPRQVVAQAWAAYAADKMS